MADKDRPLLPSPSPEQRRAAAGQFDRANQVIAGGDLDYGIQLLLECCKLDPANLVYRRILRETEDARIDMLVAQRALGSPVAYLLGKRDVWSREFSVTPDVLIDFTPEMHSQALEQVLDNAREATAGQATVTLTARAVDLGAAEGRRARDRGAPDRPPAPLLADAARDRIGERNHDRLPGSDRADQAVPGGSGQRGQEQLTAELRRDPISGRIVAIAPGRALRPGASRAQIEPVTQEELDECPFCAGREDRTPPETLRIPKQGEWLVRVVPSLYPAVERQDVVVHSPRHLRSFAELSDEEIAAVAEAWDACATAERGSGFDYVQALINEGRQAGSSLAHSHSQLVYLEEPPPIAQDELEQDSCGVCEVLGRSELLVAEENGVEAVAHYAGRLPYELLIAGSSHELALASSLTLTRDAVRRLRAIEGPVPWNAWLHQTDHPHLELVPRLTALAGLELGAGIYVNSLDPAEAAERLRNVKPGVDEAVIAAFIQEVRQKLEREAPRDGDL